MGSKTKERLRELEQEIIQEFERLKQLKKRKVVIEQEIATAKKKVDK